MTARVPPSADSSPNTAPASRARAGTLLRLFLAGLAILVLAVAVGVPLYLSETGRASRFVGMLFPELRGTARFGSVAIGWLRPLVVERAEIVPPDGGPAPITATRILGTRGLAGMLLSGGDLGGLRVEGLEIDARFDEQRRTNLEPLFALPEPEPAAPAAEPRGPRRALVRVRIEVPGAVVRIDGPWTEDPWVSDPFSLAVALRPAPGGASSEWVLEPTQLLTNAVMAPPVAEGVLAYVAPVLANATYSSGRFSLRLDGGRLPVGMPEDAALSGVLSMHEVVLGPGPMVTSVFESLPGGLPAPPKIRVADESHISFRIAERKVWHQGLRFGIPLRQPGRRLDLNSEGFVGLEDQSLDVRLSLPIPADLPEDRPLVAALAGKTLALGVGGELGKPRVKFDGSLAATAGEVFADLLGRLRERSRDQAGAAEEGASADPTVQAKPGETTTETIIDLVGGVLEEVRRRRQERRDAQRDGQADDPAARRGSFLRRVPGPASEGDVRPVPPQSDR